MKHKNALLQLAFSELAELFFVSNIFYVFQKMIKDGETLHSIAQKYIKIAEQSGCEENFDKIFEYHFYDILGIDQPSKKIHFVDAKAYNAYFAIKNYLDSSELSCVVFSLGFPKHDLFPTDANHSVKAMIMVDYYCNLCKLDSLKQAVLYYNNTIAHLF